MVVLQLVVFADSIVTSGSAVKRMLVAKIHSAIGFYQFSAIVSTLSFIFGLRPLRWNAGRERVKNICAVINFLLDFLHSWF